MLGGLFFDWAALRAVSQSTQHHRFRFASAVVSVSARGAGAPRTGAGRYIASASQVLVSALERRYGLGSLAHRAGSAIACGSAWTLCSWQLWHSPATAKLHNAALLSVSASQSQAPFVAATASRPLGEGNRLYAKLPSLGTVAQPSALPGRWHALRAAVCAPLWLLCHRGIGQALRAVWLVSGLRPVMWCVPPPTLVLRRCAAQPCALVCPRASAFGFATGLVAANA